MARSKIDEKSFNGLFFVAFGVFVIAMFFISFYLFNYVAPTTEFFQPYNKIVTNEFGDIINHQKEMNSQIRRALNSLDYIFETPYVVTNPYGINPLSAIIVFTTQKDETIKLSINGQEVTTFEATKKHIIPVYGLYSNFANKVTLELSNGNTKNIEIVTLPCDSNIGDVNTSKMIKKNEQIMFLGNIESSDSHIRGFDYYGNIIYSLDLKYLNGVKFYNNRVFVSYNPICTYDTSLPTLRVEMDYLGQIYSITDNTEGMMELKKYNVLDSYYYTKYNIYDKYNSTNYELVDALDYGNKTIGIKHDLSDMRDLLLDASPYNKKYLLSTIGDYVTFDFNETLSLFMVYEDSKIVEEYNLKDVSYIRVPRDRDVSLFVRTNNNKYYSLLTTLKK